MREENVWKQIESELKAHIEETVKSEVERFKSKFNIIDHERINKEPIMSPPYILLKYERPLTINAGDCSWELTLTIVNEKPSGVLSQQQQSRIIDRFPVLAKKVSEILATKFNGTVVVWELWDRGYNYILSIVTENDRIDIYKTR